MITLERIVAVKETIQDWRSTNQRIAFVATMGGLHAGHLRLVEEAQQLAAHVVVSIFINPLQFEAGSDIDTYPRTLTADQDKLEQLGVDLLFVPTENEMYPNGQNETVKIITPTLSEILCGEFRTGFFTGVATVVNKLFNIIQPDFALFGEKDYQQLLVIKQMVRDLNIPIEIVGVKTVRDPDGLAMSSRNQYLSESERDQATDLNQMLHKIKLSMEEGKLSYRDIEKIAMQELLESQFKPEYVSIRNAENLEEAIPQTPHIRVLAAAWVGKTRLIDNLEIC
jgi:pantoate--beta-alanine ligase